MKIFNINESSSELNEVIVLGDKNKSTLGFYPRGAYEQSASNGHIIVAQNESKKIVGYLLYSINKRGMFVYIVHLCVDKEYRQSGIANSLTLKLKNRTKNYFRGIRVRCRKDYDANKIWDKMGFILMAVIPGRGKEMKPINVWWYDHNLPDLFSSAEIQKSPAKISAVLDAVVIFSLMKPVYIDNDESHALLADWFQDIVDLKITKELKIEINRTHDDDIKTKSLNFIKQYDTVQVEQKKFESIFSGLKNMFPFNESPNYISDLKQIAYSISGDIPFFITLDKLWIRRSDKIFRQYSLSVLRPAELITYQDSLVRTADYIPNRLSGTNIRIGGLKSKNPFSLLEIFRSKSSESKASFQNRIQPYLSNPRKYHIRVISEDQNPIAFFILKKEDKYTLEIPIFRTINGSLVSTLSKHLLHYSILLSASERRGITIISDPHYPLFLKSHLTDFGFTYSSEIWIKFNLSKAVSRNELIKKISLFENRDHRTAKYVDLKCKELKSITKKTNLTDSYSLEKSLWPTKINELNIPNYIIPINPIWAMHLFDYKIASQDLFGSKPQLMFSVENIYYRSSNIRILTEPSRVLWYVTGGRRDYQGIKCLKACSYLDNVDIDTPDKLYGKYRRLGVYQLKDVLKIANNDPTKPVMAIRFTRTEVFNNPIPLNILRKIWTTDLKKIFTVRSPIKISNSLFHKLYELGTEPN